MVNRCSFYNRLMAIPLVLFLLVFPLIFASSHVAQNRMKAFAVFIGIGMIILGIRVCDEKSIASLGLRTKNSEKPTPRIGMIAQALGILLMMAGLALSIWSVCFWIGLGLTLDGH